MSKKSPDPLVSASARLPRPHTSMTSSLEALLLCYGSSRQGKHRAQDSTTGSWNNTTVECADLSAFSRYLLHGVSNSCQKKASPSFVGLCTLDSHSEEEGQRGSVLALGFTRLMFHLHLTPWPVRVCQLPMLQLEASLSMTRLCSWLSCQRLLDSATHLLSQTQ